MDVNKIENSLDQFETNIPAMLNAILRTNVQNQALLRAIINNQAIEANKADPTKEIDDFKNDSAIYSNEWMKEILIDVVSKF